MAAERCNVSLVSEPEGHLWEAQFVRNMAQRRKELGMTQAVLARHLSDRGLAFHQQTVQRIENGERPVRLNEAVLIVQTLGLGQPGKLGLDSAIDPELSEVIAHMILETAVGRVEQLMAAAELSRGTAWNRVFEAAADVRESLSSYLATVGEGVVNDALVADAKSELAFLAEYQAGLEGLAKLHPERDG